MSYDQWKTASPYDEKLIRPFICQECTDMVEFDNTAEKEWIEIEDLTEEEKKIAPLVQKRICENCQSELEAKANVNLVEIL